MAPVVATRDIDADVAAVWAVTIDWRRHADYFPLTQIEVGPEPAGVGQHFTATSRLGPVALRDPMVLTHWDTPGDGSDAGSFAIRKLGRALVGTVRAEVRPLATGTRLTWEIDVSPGPRALATLSRPVQRWITRGMYTGVLKKIAAAAEAM